jgi:hypothetical protein
MNIDSHDDFATPPLPLDFKYEEQTRTLVVIWGNGSVVKYFDIDPRLAFVSPTNPRRNRDFLDYLEFEWVPSFPNGVLVKAKRRVPAKQEIIQEATNKLNTPVARPILASQQNGERHSTVLTYDGDQAKSKL